MSPLGPILQAHVSAVFGVQSLKTAGGRVYDTRTPERSGDIFQTSSYCREHLFIANRTIKQYALILKPHSLKTLPTNYPIQQHLLLRKDSSWMENTQTY